jgi:hypothetical protein
MSQSQAQDVKILRQAEPRPPVRSMEEYGQRHDELELEPASASTLCDEFDHEAQLRSTTAKGGKTPLNWFQLGTLCAVRIVEPIAFTQIFPYVNDMMASFHLTEDPSKMGFYSGMVVSPTYLIYLLSPDAHPSWLGAWH